MVDGLGIAFAQAGVFQLRDGLFRRGHRLPAGEVDRPAGSGSAIYFAVDYNAPQPDIKGTIDQYFRGVTAGLATAAGSKEYRIGVYGSGAVCEYLKRVAAGAICLAVELARRGSGYDRFTEWDIRQESLSGAVLRPRYERGDGRRLRRVTVKSGNLSVPAVRPRMPDGLTTATTSSPASCAANCRAPKSTRTSMCSLSATSTRRRRPTSS